MQTAACTDWDILYLLTERRRNVCLAGWTAAESSYLERVVEKFASGKFMPWALPVIKWKRGAREMSGNEAASQLKKNAKKCHYFIRRNGTAKKSLAWRPLAHKFATSLQHRSLGPPLYFEVERGPWGRGWTIWASRKFSKFDLWHVTRSTPIGTQGALISV